MPFSPLAGRPPTTGRRVTPPRSRPGTRSISPDDGGTIDYTDSPDAAGPSAPAAAGSLSMDLQLQRQPFAFITARSSSTRRSRRTPPATSISASWSPARTRWSRPAASRGSAPTGRVASCPSCRAWPSGDQLRAGASVTTARTLYVLESTGNWGWGELVALSSTTLAVEGKVVLYDPTTQPITRRSPTTARLAHGRARRGRLHRRAGEPLRVQQRPRLAVAFLRAT